MANQLSKRTMCALLVAAGLLLVSEYHQYRQLGSIEEALASRREASPQARRGTARALPMDPISLTDAAIKGTREAKVALVEYSDFDCPFCATFTHRTLPILNEEYIGNGRVAFAFKQFPLDALHPNASRAAQAAVCALDQQKFWEMHDLLFARRKGDPGGQRYSRLAGSVGAIEAEVFDRCVSSSSVTARIRASVLEGKKAGVTGTPAFFIGTLQGSEVTVKARLSGAQDISAFRAALDDVLRQSEVLR